MTRLPALILALVAAGAALAQSPTPGGSPPPPGMSLASSAAMRFPQPVRVGDLAGRDVIEPVESQNYLGRVARIVRHADGTLAAIVDLAGFLRLGARPVSVPVDALALLGDVVEVVALTPAQLRELPSVAPDAGTVLPPDAVIRIGLAKPSH